jgi:hypothetical protein
VSYISILAKIYFFVFLILPEFELFYIFIVKSLNDNSLVRIAEFKLDELSYKEITIIVYNIRTQQWNIILQILTTII